MNFKCLMFSASALILGLATFSTVTKAQGPLYDKVLVNLPYTVTIGDRTLQPGDYVIRQLPSPGGASRVLLIYSDNGMKFETSSMTIPALDNRTPDDTKVVLHHFGNDYYFDKIWIQGKNYGYEFPLPDSVKARERERMAPISVAATYQATPESTKETTQQAQNTEPAPAPAPQTAPAQAEPTPAQAEPTPAPAPAPAPAETAPAPAPEASRTMPATSAGWMMMLVGGGLLTGAGVTLRRRR
jgi:hypothetical protein